MFKKIAGTAGTKITAALIGFILISINAKFLGAEGVGNIALIILGITIILLFSSLSGGAALVYLVPRHNILSLYLPAFIGSVVTSLLLAPIFGWLNWIPPGFTLHLLLLSIIRSFNANHSAILLGKERIRDNNIISLLETISLLVAVCFYFFILKYKSVESYVFSLYIAYGVNFIFSAIFIRKYLEYNKKAIDSIFTSFKAIFRYSAYNQTGNFLQLLNYRLSFYLIEYFTGLTALGIYSVGTRLSESIWIISKSMSTVQYARIANSKDEAYSNKLTILLFRITLVVTMLLTIMLVIVPTAWYVWIFSSEFEEIKTVLSWMSLGIVSLACSMAFSSYFSGTGKQHLNTIGALLGLIITMVGGFLLIPTWGLKGAAITASLAYSGTTIFYFIHFTRLSKFRLTKFIPGREDLKLMKEQWNNLKR